MSGSRFANFPLETQSNFTPGNKGPHVEYKSKTPGEENYLWHENTEAHSYDDELDKRTETTVTIMIKLYKKSDEYNQSDFQSSRAEYSLHSPFLSFWHWKSWNKYLIDRVCSGPYWENIGPRSFLHGQKWKHENVKEWNVSPNWWNCVKKTRAKKRQ